MALSTSHTPHAAECKLIEAEHKATVEAHGQR